MAFVRQRSHRFVIRVLLVLRERVVSRVTLAGASIRALHEPVVTLILMLQVNDRLVVNVDPGQLVREHVLIRLQAAITGTEVDFKQV